MPYFITFVYPEGFRFFSYADGSKVVCRTSSLATLGNHLLIAHYLYLSIDAHDVRYREMLVGEVIENVFDSILKPICADTLLGYPLCEEVEKLIAHRRERHEEFRYGCSYLLWRCRSRGEYGQLCSTTLAECWHERCPRLLLGVRPQALTLGRCLEY